MEDTILKLLKASENGKIDRRQLIQALGLTAGAALAASTVPKAAAVFASQTRVAGGRTFPAASTINHLSLAVSDYAKSRDFYVDLFGLRVAWDDGKGCAVEFGDLKSPDGMYIRPVAKPGDKPTVNHISFGIPDFMDHKAAIKAEMERLELKNIRPDTEVGWTCDDPAGYLLEPVIVKHEAMFPGALAPCVEAASAKCKEAAAAGLKNLNGATKPSGKGFKATYFSHIILNVSKDEIAKERDFYTSFLGMKVISDKADGSNPEVVLGFNKNTLYLRPTANPSDKPYCVEYGFVIQNYDKAKVKAELDRRGVGPEADADGWTFRDPDGLKIGIYAA